MFETPELMTRLLHGVVALRDCPFETPVSPVVLKSLMRSHGTVNCAIASSASEKNFSVVLGCKEPDSSGAEAVAQQNSAI